MFRVNIIRPYTVSNNTRNSMKDNMGSDRNVQANNKVKVKGRKNDGGGRDDDDDDEDGTFPNYLLSLVSSSFIPTTSCTSVPIDPLFCVVMVGNDKLPRSKMKVYALTYQRYALTTDFNILTHYHVNKILTKQQISSYVILLLA